MIFVDQPNQVGFSYDIPTNGTLDLTTSAYSPQPPANVPPQLLLPGTFPSGNPQNTANTTQNAAMAVYHLIQGLSSVLPNYILDKNAPLGINLFTESYGGHYGPVFADAWVKENDKLRKRGAMPHSKSARTRTTTPAKAREIKLASLGIMNGCIDDLIQGKRYAEMAINNTYGIQLIDQATADGINAAFDAPETGCNDLVMSCRQAQAALDPNETGTNTDVNNLCAYAAGTCQQLLLPVAASGVDAYDIAHKGPSAFPDYHYIEYLNQRRVQEAIGSVINYTDVSPMVNAVFFQTGDRVRGGLIAKLAGLLQRGVRVGLVYGDRDYICNWLGGEDASLAVAAAMKDLDPNSPYPTKFAQAGYAPLTVNGRETGAVRQFGNFSFSRIYQAGHFVPAYQPETAFRVFERVIGGKAVNSGAGVDLKTYQTSGPSKSTKTLTPPAEVVAKCFLRNIANTCTPDQVGKYLQGEGVVINGVWYAQASDWSPVTKRGLKGGKEGGEKKMMARKSLAGRIAV